MHSLTRLLTTTAIIGMAASPAWALDAQTAAKFDQLLAIIEQQNQKIERLENRLNQTSGQTITPVTDTKTYGSTPRDVLADQEKLRILERQIDHQQEQITVQAETLHELKKQKDSAVKITKRGASPQFDFGDGTTFNIHGRIQTDYALFDDGDTAADIPDQADIRRLFFGARGTIDHDWAYSFFVDFANGPGGERPTIQDAWVAYNGFDNLNLRVGNQTELFSIEQQVSNLNQSFIERSIVHDAFHPVRSIGATARYYEDNWTLAGGVFGDSPNDGNDTDDQEFAFGTRGTYAPILNNDHYLHLGGALRYASPNGTDAFTFNARPGSRLSDGIFGANTGAIANTEDSVTYGAELIYNYGPILLQAEYTGVDVGRNNGSSDVYFDGFYVHGSWFLTGENRKYNHKTGSLGRITPKKSLTGGGIGAWEIAARYATLDLTDGDITGGELDTFNLALNWYPQRNIRFDLNYIHNDADSSSPLGDSNVDAVVMRAQVDF